MSNQIIVPPLGESVSEATVAKWYKNIGDTITRDELLVELETDKVTLEVNALESGTLSEITVQEGDNVAAGDVLGAIAEGSAAANSGQKASAPAAAATVNATASTATKQADNAADISGPAARKIAAENNLNLNQVPGTGKDGRVTKGDALAAASAPTAAPVVTNDQRPTSNEPRETRVRMTKLRKVIAKRLKDSQNTAAILTTFNEVDMTNVMALRKKHQDAFVKKHDIKVGFMSFFTKAAIAALKEIPAVNAEIEGDELVYKNHYDIGMAVGTPQGLVVPVVRDADQLSFAGIEKTIGELAKKGRDGKLSIDELQGGTFTISNGGVYGSMLSTPIINPPQSGILGLHNITKRAMVMPDGSIQARPMMYLALSYDHRIIDGREAVTFLVKVKEAIENPERLLLEV